MKNKKMLLFILLLILTLLVSSTTAFADTKTSTPGDSKTNDISMPLKDIYGPETKQRPDLDKSGKVSPLTYYNIRLWTPSYSQNDSQWASNIMQTTGQTISNAGCLVTDVAGIDYFYGQSSSTPAWVNTNLGNNACPLVWSALANLPGNYIKGVSTNINNPTRVQFCSIAVNAITSSNPKPVLLSYNRSGRSHWLLVTAVSGDGTQLWHFGCIDPLNGSYNNLNDVVGTQALLQVAVLSR
jgi:hypothetical protein